MRKSAYWMPLIAMLALLMASCAPSAPQTVEVPVEVTKVVVETQVVEVPAEPTEKTVIEFWTTDNEEERVEVYETIAARFMAENPEYDVRIVPIDEATISQRIATAQAANRLPDIVRMGVERVATFAADEILDEDAATATIQSIGEDDFRAGPLQMVTDPATGKYAAVPFDGWIQAIWYRADVFGQAGLEPPTTWEAINEACDKLPGTGNLLYALTLGTDPGQNYPHQTGFAPMMAGPNGAASYGQLVTLGIMKGADPGAQKVVEFFLSGQNYLDVLALAPFGKVPVLKSAVDGWKGLSDFFQHYSDETLEQIANGYETMQRWLFRPDYDATQRAVIGDIEGRLLIPQAISNIALEGNMTPETAAAWLQEQVEALLAERQG